MEYDVCIIGGGINGAAIAADAASRGLKVCLCEQNDFASGTSSASSKLIHGGLRYLELYEFRLVHEALRERSILLKRAPHLVYPLKFILPDNEKNHSPFLLQLGLWLYDFLARDKKLARSQRIDLKQLPAPSRLKFPNKGFSYTDCWGYDARLVIANLQLATLYDATLYSHTKFIDAEPTATHWRINLANNYHTFTINAKAIINAAGPWVDAVKEKIHPQHNTPSLKLVKGSHIIIKRFYAGEHAYVLQNDDKRIIFLIPFDDDKLIIGTTDVIYKGDPALVEIDEAEINYLKNIVEQYFNVDIKPQDILSHYSGVRPLYNDNKKLASENTRDYHLALSAHPLPLINIYGGKLTTHRALAEKVISKLKSHFPHLSKPTTEWVSLPGGNIEDFTLFMKALHEKFVWVPPKLLKRLAHYYGTYTEQVLEGTRNIHDLGHCFGADLYEKEVRYLIDYEWAQTAEDILWRRTQLGFNFTPEQIVQLSLWVKNHVAIQN